MEENENIFDPNLVWVRLKKPFLVIKETLNRIGISSKKDKILYQSCHILHKRGKYAIVHFKELFMLDGKPSDFSENDKARRNTIINLLVEWDLIELENPEQTKEPLSGMGGIKILSNSEKKEWTLQAKHQIESRHNNDTTTNSKNI